MPARPLIAVHGWSCAGAVLAPALGAALPGRRVVPVDLRGHGASPSGAPFGLDDLARDLAAMAGAVGPGPIDLMGWSLGGLVALAALPVLGARVERLVLVGATPRFTKGGDWAHGAEPRALAAVAARTRRDPARAVEAFWDGMFSPAERDLSPPRPGGLPVPAQADLLAGLDVLAAADLRAALPAVRAATLVVHGEADPVCPAGAGRALAGAIPGARLVLVPGAGHAPFLSAPGAFAAAVAEFLP
ncbi:MAG: alpha/beta fold hydrolase [Anaeromyxobacter sp.]